MLASSIDGVKTMHRMMNSDEPEMMKSGEGISAGRNEHSLKALMRDPRYWRDQEPAIVAEVREGFQRLYPDGT
jgi:hypothetical protein